MKKLTTVAFERARTYLKTRARALDRAVFEHRFEGGSTQNVLTELASYRNDDGGFGRALEPDVRTPSSSSLATGIALELLREMDIPLEHPVLQQATAYLVRTLDAKQRTWRVVPEDVNEHPHAPWWHDEAGSLAATFDDFLIIPRAQLVALLQHFRDAVPSGWLRELTEATAADILRMDPSQFGGGGDTLACAWSLYQGADLQPSVRDALWVKLREVTEGVVCRDPALWGGYCAKPLKIAPTPESPALLLLWPDVERQLDYEIDQQEEDGSWRPTWTWAGLYPEAWQQADTEWRGHLTLEMLTTLRAFGRTDSYTAP